MQLLKNFFLLSSIPKFLLHSTLYLLNNSFVLCQMWFKSKSKLKKVSGVGWNVGPMKAKKLFSSRLSASTWDAGFLWNFRLIVRRFLLRINTVKNRDGRSIRWKSEELSVSGGWAENDKWKFSRSAQGHIGGFSGFVIGLGGKSWKVTLLRLHVRGKCQLGNPTEPR